MNDNFFFLLACLCSQRCPACRKRVIFSSSVFFLFFFVFVLFLFYVLALRSFRVRDDVRLGGSFRRAWSLVLLLLLHGRMHVLHLIVWCLSRHSHLGCIF